MSSTSKRDSDLGNRPSMSGAAALEAVAPAALGKYSPFARLGHGGMADVFLAVARGPVGFNKLAVVKRLHRSEDLQMFLDEARLSARLSHPNIVNTYEVGEASGQYFIAMEYLEGQPLQAILTDWSARGVKIEETVAAFAAMQALRGLHYAHELADYDGTPLHVVHRDVSPQNLFITYQGEVKLLDFGIAKAALNSTQTETGVLKGKIRYMAPEQMVEKTIDRRADVFALGIVLWEMLTGTRLYTGNMTTVLARVTMEDAPSVSSLRADVSQQLEAIVSRALERDLDRRYPTADAMRADLEKFLHGKVELSQAALGRLVNDGFGVTRDAVRARIKTFLAQIPPHVTNSMSGPDLGEDVELLPALFGDASAEPAPAAELVERPRPLVTSGATSANTKSGVSISMPTMPTGITPTSTRSRGGLWATGAIIAATVAFVALRARPHPAVAPAAQMAEGPIASASAPVHIDTSPAGALVDWRGTRLGRTPVDVALPVGAQTVLITRDGYEPQELSIDVQPGVPVAKAVALRSLDGKGDKGDKGDKADKADKADKGAVNAAPPPSRVTRSSFHHGAHAGLANAPPTPAPVAAAAPIAAPAPAPPAQTTAPTAAPRAKIRVVDDTDSP